MLGTYCLVPGIAGIVSTSFNWLNMAMLIAISLLYGSYIVYSDVKDIKGDKISNKQTFVLVLGLQHLPLLGFGLALISLIILFLLSVSGASIPVVIVLLTFVFCLGQIVLIIKPTLLLSSKLRQIVGYGLLGSLILSVYSFLQ